MDKVGIVVLNYLNYEDTIECVESLLDLNYNNYEIVVVDNGSDNESYEVLKNEIQDHINVYLLNTGKNLGYAKGNNYGIDFCRNELRADHVMVINNDTIAEDKSLLNFLISNKDKGLVLGPKIINLNDNNQNPARIFSTKFVLKKILYFITKTLFIYNLIKKMRFKKKKLIQKNKFYTENSDKIVLHGSCLFFTDRFFEYYKGFFDKTFLYFEEDILYLLLKKSGNKFGYVKDTYIIHKEDRSSELAFNNKSEVVEKFTYNSCKWFLIIWILPYNFINRIFDI
jgi:GT2 family glycosyltransferase